VSKITKHRAEVYTILTNLFIKFIFAIVAIGAFIAVLAKMLNIENPTWESVGPYAVFDTLIGGTVFVVFRHYFPNNK
jgi:hypothetical protein